MGIHSRGGRAAFGDRLASVRSLAIWKSENLLTNRLGGLPKGNCTKLRLGIRRKQMICSWSKDARED